MDEEHPKRALRVMEAHKPPQIDKPPHIDKLKIKVVDPFKNMLSNLSLNNFNTVRMIRASLKNKL